MNTPTAPSQHLKGNRAMRELHYFLLVLLAPQLIADRHRAALRRKCANLVIADRRAAQKGGAA